MTKTIPIAIYIAACIRNAANCLYPYKIEISDEAPLKLAFSKNLVCAQYRNNYRSIDNFELSNAMPVYYDNDHSDKPMNWITPLDLTDFFVDVRYVVYFSRHHIKSKGSKGPRPRFHVVFLIEPERNAESNADLPTVQDRRKSAARAELPVQTWLYRSQTCGNHPEFWEEALGGLPDQSRCAGGYLCGGGTKTLSLLVADNGPGLYAQKLQIQRGNFP